MLNHLIIGFAALSLTAGGAFAQEQESEKPEPTEEKTQSLVPQ